MMKAAITKSKQFLNYTFVIAVFLKQYHSFIHQITENPQV